MLFSRIPAERYRWTFLACVMEAQQVRHPQSMEAQAQWRSHHLLGRSPYTLNETPCVCSDTRHWVLFH